jgi:hypothetical protein
VFWQGAAYKSHDQGQVARPAGVVQCGAAPVELGVIVGLVDVGRGHFHQLPHQRQITCVGGKHEVHPYPYIGPPGGFVLLNLHGLVQIENKRKKKKELKTLP